MKPVHVIAYAAYRIVKIEAKIEARKVRYAIAKLAYEAKFLPKLFGWKYENSIEGDDSWCGSWFSWDECALRDFQNLRSKAIYCDKMEYVTMQLPDGICEDSFYKWCAENNIPY